MKILRTLLGKKVNMPVVLMLPLYVFMFSFLILGIPVVSGQSVTDLLVHFDQGGGDSWINTGNVGIGTIDPSETLEVNGNYKFTGSNTSSYPPVERVISTADVISNPASWMRADNLVLKAGNVSENGNSNGTAGSVFIKAGQRNVGGTSGTDANKYGIIGFYTGTTNVAESMRINWNGDVGIGITSPSSKLDVSGVVTSSGTQGGKLVANNPNNQTASVSLSWLNDIARIRVGGDGVGAGNGFMIQGVGNVTYLRIYGNGQTCIGNC